MPLLLYLLRVLSWLTSCFRVRGRDLGAFEGLFVDIFGDIFAEIFDDKFDDKFDDIFGDLVSPTLPSPQSIPMRLV